LSSFEFRGREKILVGFGRLRISVEHLYSKLDALSGIRGKIQTMARFGHSLIVLIFLAFIPAAYFGQDIEIKKPKQPRTPPTKQPKPKLPTNGVLSVVTTPAIAKVIIKDEQGNKVKEGQTKDGTYQVELRPGAYTIEVTADRYLPRILRAEVERSKAGVVPAQLAPAFGSILISMGSVGPDATILIDEQKPANLTRKAENRIQIDDIPVGSHLLRIAHPSVASYEEKVEVTGGVPTFVAPVFRFAMTNLLIRSEPRAEIYIDGVMVGKTLDNGELRIPDRYKPGQHTIRAEKDFFDPAQEIKNLGIGDSEVELKLTRIKSSPEFGDDFHEGLKFWETPSSWQVTRSVLAVRGSEAGLQVGLVKDKNYTDFKMTLDIRFTNGKGAVWIVRARDKRNFYLFQLHGPKGANPRFFRSYIAQNGQLTMLTSAVVYQDLTRPNDSYKITIEARGPTIRHFIQLNSDAAGGSQPFSTLQDSTFLYGTVGLGSYEGEEFVVSFVTVLPDESASR
jgi:hypothetical protein